MVKPFCKAVLCHTTLPGGHLILVTSTADRYSVQESEGLYDCICASLWRLCYEATKRWVCIAVQTEDHATRHQKIPTDQSINLASYFIHFWFLCILHSWNLWHSGVLCVQSACRVHQSESSSSPEAPSVNVSPARSIIQLLTHTLHEEWSVKEVAMCFCKQIVFLRTECEHLRTKKLRCIFALQREWARTKIAWCHTIQKHHLYLNLGFKIDFESDFWLNTKSTVEQILAGSWICFWLKPKLLNKEFNLFHW